jgi:hypothetical protein
MTFPSIRPAWTHSTGSTYLHLASRLYLCGVFCLCTAVCKRCRQFFGVDELITPLTVRILACSHFPANICYISGRATKTSCHISECVVLMHCDCDSKRDFLWVTQNINSRSHQQRKFSYPRLHLEHLHPRAD